MSIRRDGDFQDDTKSGFLVHHTPLRSREHLEDAHGTKQASIDVSSVRFAIAELDRLEESTRPSAGSTSAIGKDKAAFQALELAASLMRQLAGWAIKHQNGLANNRLGSAAAGWEDPNPNSRTTPDHADRHLYEEIGDLDQKHDSVQARQFLLNVLRPLAGELKFGEAVEALNALAFGETLPIFRQATLSKRTRLPEFRAKLKAICHIAYQRKKSGTLKKHTVDEVAVAFAANPESMKDWRAEVSKALGKDYVDGSVRLAEASGDEYRRQPADSHLRPYYEDQFGMPALLRAATVYRSRGMLPG